MGRKIIWSQLSKVQLRKIYDYHFTVASERIALRLIEKIISNVDILVEHPQAGQLEESLAAYPQKFRYLVEGMYKIVYYTDVNSVTIVSVFDCRQDPAKIHIIK